MNNIHKTQLFRWNEIPREKLNNLLERQIINGERIMLTHIYLKKGAIVPTHQHENEQLSYILKGKLKFWVGQEMDQTYTVRDGEVLHLPSGVFHGAEAIEETLSIDIFSPPRQDWLDGSDNYLRGN